MKKLYTESEVQGPGRRFWFRNRTDRDTFANAKRRAGYSVFAEGRTAWASRSKKRSHAIDLVIRGGVDPWALGR